MKKVSIIIPSYNHATYIEKAIKSALDQTYENIELIIIDDASTDNSKEIISRYLTDPRIRAIFKEKNKGQGHSLNMAISMANGTYISFLPSDDWYLPKKTELQVNLFESISSKVGLVYGQGLRYFENTGEINRVSLPMHRGNVLYEIISSGNFVYPASPMIRKSVFENIRFDESYSAEGESIYVRIAERYEFDFLEEPVVVMRAHTYNTGSAYKKMYIDNIRWWTEYFKSPLAPNEVLTLKRLVLSRLHRMYGLSLITESLDMRTARSALIKSILNRPPRIFDLKIFLGIVITFLPRFVAARIIQARKNVSI
jgi:glycosyltransferase involved in cell wall biosynthesis